MTTANRKTRRMRLPANKVATVATYIAQRAVQLRGDIVERNIDALQGYNPKAYAQLHAVLRNTTIDGCTIDDLYIPETSYAIVNKAIAILRGRA